jgi:putative FmdB family regulatory protein
MLWTMKFRDRCLNYSGKPPYLRPVSINRVCQTMPIYEYACNACGHQFEIMQKISDPLASVCPACGAAEVRKLISRAGFQLKGGG